MWNMAAPCVCTGNEIAKISAHTFLGLPNLEWLDLSNNTWMSEACTSMPPRCTVTPLPTLPGGPGQSKMAPGVHYFLPHPAWGIRCGGSTAQSNGLG